MTDLDYSGYEEKGLTDEERLAKITLVSKLAPTIPALELAVTKAEEALAKAQKALADVAERDLPALFEDLDMVEYPLRDGGKLVMKEKVAGSIAEPNRPKAFSWLRGCGQGSLIKRQVIVEFGMGEESKAAKLLASFAKRKDPLRYSDKESIHPSTLTSFVREQLEAGRELPDTITVFRGKTVKYQVSK